MKWIVKMVMVGLAVMVCDLVLPGIYVENYWWAVVLAVVLAFLNSVVKPVLIFLTLPATIVTFGLFLLVINAITIEIADWIIEEEFQVRSFWWALLFSLLLSIVTSVFEGFEKEKDNKQDTTKHLP